MKLKNLTQILLENGINAEYKVEDFGAPENPGKPGNIVRSIEIDASQKVKFFNFIAKHNDEWKIISKDNVRYMESVSYSTTDKCPKMNTTTHFMPKDVYGIRMYYDTSSIYSRYYGVWPQVDQNPDSIEATLSYTIETDIDNYRNYTHSFDVILGGLK